MDRFGRIGANATVRRELKRRPPPSCSSRPTTLSPVSRIALFSMAPEVQIFGPTTCYCRDPQRRVTDHRDVSGHGREGDSAVLSD